MAVARAFTRKPRLYKTGAKVRNVIFLVYMEDLEALGLSYYNLCAYLDSMHVKAVVSPIHDRDLFTSQDVLDWCTRHEDPSTGDLMENYIDSAPFVGKPKKAHVHVGIVSKSQRSAKEWADFMAGLIEIRPSMFEKMEDFEGFVRYCAHLDSPEKTRYNAFEIVGIANPDLTCLSKTTEGDKVRSLVELRDLARDNGIRSYHRLFDFVLDSGDLDLIAAFRANSGQLSSYFRSKQYERSIKQKRKEQEAKLSESEVGNT